MEHGMDPREFAGLSQAELSLRMGTDAAMMGAWKKGRKGKVGRQQKCFCSVVFLSRCGSFVEFFLWYYGFFIWVDFSSVYEWLLFDDGQFAV